jgi:hypothetical protein
METVSSTYEWQIEAAVQLAVRLHIRSFESICQSCSGAFPVDVLSAIERLSLAGAITGSQVIFPQDDASCEEDNKSTIPEPSPMDYEWRFSEETAESISRLAANLGDKLMCFGTPTVFRCADGKGAAFLVDRNPFIKELLNVSARTQTIIADISDLKPDPTLGTFDVIVMDPPWYENHFAAWLRAATFFGRKGTKVITTLFSTLVRPNAADERDSILALLRKLGNVAIMPHRVVYETPRFECETLAQFGIHGLRSWRTADLIQLTLNDPLALLHTPQPNVQRWHRFRIGTQLIGVADKPEGGTVTVKPPYKDGSFLLRSVSSREPFKPIIGFWTSRNRAAIVTGNQKIIAFLGRLEAGMDLNDAMDHNWDSHDKAALRNLVDLIGL